MKQTKKGSQKHANGTKDKDINSKGSDLGAL